jgi:hypothetical protein
MVRDIDDLRAAATESAAVLTALREATPDEVPALFERAERAWKVR